MNTPAKRAQLQHWVKSVTRAPILLNIEKDLFSHQIV